MKYDMMINMMVAAVLKCQKKLYEVCFYLMQK